MKKYINAKAEIYKLDAGDIMLVSAENLNFENWSPDSDNPFSKWGNWNA